MTTQIEELVWHKYPDEKPPNIYGRYLLHVRFVSVSQGKVSLGNDEFVRCHYYSGDNNMSSPAHWDDEKIVGYKLIAWADPKGWQE